MRAGRSDRSEIADAGVIGSLCEIDGVDQLRHQKGDVRVALPVSIGGPIDRHVVDEIREIGAVVKIVAPDQVLRCFAFARVDGYDQPGNALEKFSRAIDRTQFDLPLADCTLAGGRCTPQQVDPRGSHDNLVGCLQGLKYLLCVCRSCSLALCKSS